MTTAPTTVNKKATPKGPDAQGLRSAGLRPLIDRAIPEGGRGETLLGRPIGILKYSGKLSVVSNCLELTSLTTDN